jgi:polysaccharide biosynthesis/export protein
MYYISRLAKIRDWVIMGSLFLSVSCVPYKEVRYFNDLNETTVTYTNVREQKRIKPFDNLYIRILSTDKNTSDIFNSSGGYGGSNLTSSLISYLVDEKGDINFPFVGDIKVDGLTTSQANDKINKALSDYITNTAVVVKFYDNKVTLMGEVSRPGQFNFTQDMLSIYEAISLAGGFTRFANHRNVVLIRQENNKVTHYKIDLSNTKIASQELYYIMPNDVIVVEPLRAVSFSYQNVTYSTILTTITTIMTIWIFVDGRL